MQSRFTASTESRLFSHKSLLPGSSNLNQRSKLRETGFNRSFRASVGNLALNQPLEGTLDDTDPLNPSSLDPASRGTTDILFPNMYSDRYVLTGLREGQRINLELNSTAFKPHLQLINARGWIVQQDDVYGKRGSQSNLTFTARPKTQYFVNVTSYEHRQIGDYKLTATPNGFDRNDKTVEPKLTKPKIDGRIRPDQELEDQELNKQDRRNSLKSFTSYSDDYRLRDVKVGQQMKLQLNSEGFAPQLQVLDARGAVIWEAGAFATDKNREAFGTFTILPKTQYTVRVTSKDPNKTGDYTLSLSKAITPKSSANFNYFWGSGLVDASAAVARATGLANPFADVPNLTGTNWHLNMINAPEVWAQGFTGKGVTVAVIDTGINSKHPDLGDNFLLSKNFVEREPNASGKDVSGHGSHVAGIIAAARNEIGITGVAYNAKILPVRTGGEEDENGNYVENGYHDYDDVADGIRDAIKRGAKVINMSLGDYDLGIGKDLEDALRDAKKKGVTVIISSGNDRQDLNAKRPGDPAYFAATEDLGIVVGSVNSRKLLAIDSNPAGNQQSNFVVAPGNGIRSTVLQDKKDKKGKYEFMSGTSMAAPHVAGVVALMLEAKPNLTVKKIQEIISSTANPAGLRVF